MRKLHLTEELARGPSYDAAVICTYALDVEFLQNNAMTHTVSGDS